MSNQFKGFTKAFLEKKGFFETVPGRFITVKSEKQTGVPAGTYKLLPKLKRGRPKLEPLMDTSEFEPDGIKIILAGIAPGLNGSNGILREHWRKRTKRLENYMMRLKCLPLTKFQGRVDIIYTRYSSGTLDYDNLVGSAKILFDAMKNNQIIKDDSPFVIGSPVYQQEKCKLSEQRTEIIIKNYAEK